MMSLLNGMPMKSRFDQFVKEVKERRTREFKVPTEELWLNIDKRLKKRQRLRRLYTFFGVIVFALLIGGYLIGKKESNKTSEIQAISIRTSNRHNIPKIEFRKSSIGQRLNQELKSDNNTKKASLVNGSEATNPMHTNEIIKIIAQNSESKTVQYGLAQTSLELKQTGVGFDELQQIQQRRQEFSITFDKCLNPLLSTCPSLDHCLLSHASKESPSKRFNIGLSTGVLVTLKSFVLLQNNSNISAPNLNEVHSNSWQTNFDFAFQPSTHIAFKTGIGYGTQHLTNEVKDAIVAYDTITEMLTINSSVSVINVSTTNLLSDDYEDQDGLEFEPDDSSNIMLTYTNKTSVGVINVPLQMSFGFGFKQITLGITGGLNLSYLKNASTEVSFTGYSSPKYSIQNNLSKVSIGTKLDLGIEFALTESFNFSAALNYFHTITPYLQGNYASVKPEFLGFSAGLKYLFK